MTAGKLKAISVLSKSKTVEKAYDDLISPPAKKIGIALSTVLDIGNTFLWPVKWVNERTRLFFQNNLKKYEDKLNDMPEEMITSVASEIAIPILERFTYVSNEELSQAFVELLGTASHSNTAKYAHPGFIHVIDRLSPDEAKILKYLKEHDAFPCIDIRYYEDISKSSFQYIAINETDINQYIELTFPDNIGLYLDNLISLGIIILNDDYYTTFEDRFIELRKSSILKSEYLKEIGSTNELLHQKLKMSKKMFAISDYGGLFIEACIKN